MSDLDSKKLIAHLSNKWSGRRCPLCNTGNWNVSDKVYELREFHGGGLVIGGTPIVPVVPVTCDNCGNTVLVNTIVAGLTPQEQGESNDK